MEGPAAERPAGESLPRDERLRRRADFLRCYQRGRRRHGSLVILYIVEREGAAERPRLGISAGRKVGGAVVRFRVKRRIREIYRRWSERERLPPVDLLVHVRPTAGGADFRTLEEDLTRLLRPLVREPRPDAPAGRQPRR